MKICPKCRKENSNNNVFCEKCGARLGSRNSSAGNNSANKKASKRALTIVMCVLVFFLVIEGIVLFFINKDSNKGDGKKSEDHPTADIKDDEDSAESSSDETKVEQDAAAVPTGQIPFDAALINGNYYKVYHLDEIDTWQKAQQYCIEQGGHLAVITSQELNDSLYKLCRSQGFETAFFGFSDAGSEGEWLWVTQSQPAYLNWGVSEPNSGSSEEDFAIFSTSERNGTWNDSSFGYETTAFICQGGDAGIEDSKKELKIPDDALVYEGHSYYLFDNDMKSWAEAEQYCRSLGGYMAIINNSEENEMLYNYMTEHDYKAAFFGYSDKEKEGKWLWYGDDRSTFEDWGVNVRGVKEPNQDKPYSDYAQLLVTLEKEKGHWNDAVFGTYSHAYICEWNTVKE